MARTAKMYEHDFFKNTNGMYDFDVRMKYTAKIYEWHARLQCANGRLYIFSYNLWWTSKDADPEFRWTYGNNS